MITDTAAENKFLITTVNPYGAGSIVVTVIKNICGQTRGANLFAHVNKLTLCPNFNGTRRYFHFIVNLASNEK